MKSVSLWKIALVLAVAACGVAEGPVEFAGAPAAEPKLGSLVETSAAGAAGAAGAESD